ncbi:DUF4214 domain-containing protein [Salinicola sp. 4072]|uniref:DUF4214 domain-containing protein n=1 Tax=Salinicola sp. 4072 TaxID=3082157 RepID=UPI002FC7AA8C
MATQASLDRVQELYVAYYGRPADQEGQEYWADRLDDEGEGAIINAFGNSAEYDELSEGQGNATLVDNLYQQMFGRHADPEGLTYYTGVLESGDKTLAEIATTILNAASGVDMNEFNAKVEAAADYTETYGSADDYDVVAGKDVVDSAEGGLYTPELTPAIEDYQDAQEALSDYLQDTVAANETVADELTVDVEDATDGDISGALTSAISTAAGKVESNGSYFDDSDAEVALTLNSNASVAQAQIAAVKEEQAADLADAQEAISETNGLQAAISSMLAAGTRYETALNAQAETSEELGGEFAKFGALNSDDTFAEDTNADDNVLFTIEQDDGGTPTPVSFLEVNASGEVVLAEDFQASDYEGLDALISDAQAQYDAEQATDKSLTALNGAIDRVETLDDSTDENGITITGDGDNDADENGEFEVGFTFNNGSDAGAFVNAQTAVDNFDEAVADYQELTGLQDQVDDLNDAVDDAKDAIEEQDVKLAEFSVDTDADTATADATDGNDLFIFDADAADTQTIGVTTDFGGEDQIYVGNSFTAVNLDLDSGDTLNSTDQGDVNTLEVFFQQGDDGAVLSFENKAFAGSAENGFDGTTVTLTGVNAEDLQLENGYISIA